MPTGHSDAGSSFVDAQMALGCNIKLTVKANQDMYKELTSNISEYFPMRRKKNKWMEGGRVGTREREENMFKDSNIQCYKHTHFPHMTHRFNDFSHKSLGNC